MRLRDIDRPGCYGRHTSGCVHPQDNDGSGPEQNGIHISMINVASFALLAIVPLAQFARVPIVTTEDAEDCRIIDPAALLNNQDDWRFLFDGNERDFGPHTAMVKMLELAGASENDARAIARKTLIAEINKQMNGGAERPATSKHARNWASRPRLSDIGTRRHGPREGDPSGRQ